MGKHRYNLYSCKPQVNLLRILHFVRIKVYTFTSGSAVDWDAAGLVLKVVKASPLDWRLVRRELFAKFLAASKVA